MFGISGIELFMILAVAFLIFGPEEMPKIGRIIGQALRMFNDARQEVETVIHSEILTPEDAVMLKDPLGMKGMRNDLEKTLQQMADPTYKPVPKGGGMRVATDDILESEVEEAVACESEVTTGPPGADVEIDPDDVASIWGMSAGDSDAH